MTSADVTAAFLEKILSKNGSAVLYVCPWSLESAAAT